MYSHLLNAANCCAASAFRTKWKDVVKQADNAYSQLSTLQKACSKETSVQVMPSHALC